MKQESSPNRRQPLRTHKNRRTTPPPPEVESWLAAVNGIPKDQIEWLTILPTGGIPTEWDVPARNVKARHARERKIQELRNRTTDWGREAKAYIFGNESDPEPGERLNKLYTALTTFQAIARIAKENETISGGVTIPISAGMNTARLVSDRGVLKIRNSPFLEMLDEIEVWRIRSCPVCQKMFWAGRRDKSTCSEICSGDLRQQRFRKRQKLKQMRPRKEQR